MSLLWAWMQYVGGGQPSGPGPPMGQAIWGRFHQHVYAQLLRTQNPKVQKLQLNHQYLFTLMVYARIKAACKTLVKLTPGPPYRYSSSGSCRLPQWRPPEQRG